MDGDMPRRGDFRVSVSKDYLVFASAHFITFAGHRCEGLHGHNYRARVTIEGALDEESWFVFDFVQLKRLMRGLCDELGATGLVIHDVVGGAETPVVATKRRYKIPRVPLTIDIADEQGRPVPARVAVIGSDGRAAAPVSAWMHADDGFDRSLQASETHYFHCPSRCTVEVPAGATSVWVQRGFRYLPWQQTVKLVAGADRAVLFVAEQKEILDALAKRGDAGVVHAQPLPARGAEKRQRE